MSLLLVMFMGQMQQWMWNNTIDNSIAQNTGHIQVTDTAYVDEAILDNSISIDQVAIDSILSLEEVRGVYPRINFGALASYNIQAKSVGVAGFTPSTDSSELKLAKKLKKGELLNDDDKSILITTSMAAYFKVDVGDTLVLIGQGYQGMTAAGLYPIKGIVNYPAGPMSNIAFMAMKECQYFYAMEGRVTNVLINLHDNKDLFITYDQVKNIVTDPALVVRNWEEVNPGFKEGMEIDTASKNAMMSVLLVIVAFGIFGTIVMMFSERIMEFSILLSIGMRKQKILATTLIEIFMLTSLGVIASWVIITPILYYINQNPIPMGGGAEEAIEKYGFEAIMSVGLYPEVYISSAKTILTMTALMSIYLAVKILSLKPLSGTQKQ
ncbi:FtsX-like permease family protein [Cyclobacteriaceae bacterium]|nr:FtsX-like permease family protein [Cyclobacteriaceae bacterium]